ncbi:hypothetical protein DPMN_183875 [Dreissena polymorpha]|uniref:Uncharacterized protein n=1 Tax=Dreissena polymorpha TaxID=45954 RepID=A0A9D4I6R9_DREPO|nr:hypothetical protein DPMN_183875 [Dreissena polymorpha]
MALPGGSVDQLRSMLANARELTSEMRHQRSGTENTIRRRPGPTARKLRLRYYLLPANGLVPILSDDKDQALIAAHHQCNYGKW